MWLSCVVERKETFLKYDEMLMGKVALGQKQALLVFIATCMQVLLLYHHHDSLVVGQIEFFVKI
jgi:hypothetical protein